MTLALLITAVGGAWADEATITLKCGTTEKTYENVTLPWSTTADILKAVVTDFFDVNIDAISGGDGKVVKYGSEQFTVTGTFSGEATVVVSWYNSSKQSATITVTAPGPLLTLNEAKTEATMEMPSSDVTVSYELVRDIATGVRALVNNGAERIYVTKVEDKFVPKEAITYKLTDVLDQNNQFDLTEGTDYQKVGLHILDGSTWKDVTDESDLKPGTYEMIFEGLGKYDGKVYSQEFLLSNGYELTIAAGEYATFYHNEKLSIEDSDAEIYTIASVNTTEAVLSEKMTVAPSETPLLVYNAGTEKKTFLLMPTDDEASEVLVAAEFRGTLAAKDMPASSTNMDYYVCTGKAFTWVKEAGQIAANRCWLQIGGGNQPAATRASSRAITRGIGGIDGTTGIDTIDNEQFANDTYYDLNGRKVQNPTRGGIYIHNGKKVIKH